MPLKLKLKTLDGLEANVKLLYKEVNGEFILDVETTSDKTADDDKRAKEIEAMAAKNKELLGELKKNKDAKRTLEEAKAKEEEDKLKKSGDHEALAKSYQEKIAQRDAQIKEMVDKNNASMIDNTVKTIAAKLCDGGNVSLIEPHIRKRFGIDEKGELKVLDASGQLSVTTQEELVTEFQSNTIYSPLLRGTSSSGGGASGGSAGGAGVPKQHASIFDKLVAERENPSVKK